LETVSFPKWIQGFMKWYFQYFESIYIYIEREREVGGGGILKRIKLNRINIVIVMVLIWYDYFEKKITSIDRELNLLKLNNLRDEPTNPNGRNISKNNLALIILQRQLLHSFALLHTLTKNCCIITLH
jgi:hypothetical protein